MSAKEQSWKDLFAESEPDATVDLFLIDPDQFISRATEIIGLLSEFETDHEERRPDVRFVRFEEPTKLRKCLYDLREPLLHPELFATESEPEQAAPGLQASSFARLQKLTCASLEKQAGAMKLIERFEAFQAEAWSYVNPQQDVDKRRATQQRRDAAKAKRAKKLPDTDKLKREYEEIAAGPQGPRFAAGILAGKYKVSPGAVRKALKKNQNVT